MNKSIISKILIIVGLIIIIYPISTEKYYDHKQEKLMQEWNRKLEIIDMGENEETEVIEETKEADEGTEGILTIKNIDLTIPILKGATQENLKSSVATIKDNIKAGEIGNYSIAGHRSHTYGRNFNRLDELNKGDSIEVHTKEGKYKYIISEKIYVKPEDVEVLRGNDKDKEITLVTCHPMINPTHRLIIKGLMRD